MYGPFKKTENNLSQSNLTDVHIKYIIKVLQYTCKNVMEHGNDIVLSGILRMLCLEH